VEPLPPPPRLDPATAPRLRELLVESSFPEIADSAEGILDTPLPRRQRRPLFARLTRLPGLDARTALEITFSEQMPVPRAAIGDELTDLLLAGGLLVEDPELDGWVRSYLSLVMVEGALVIADRMGVQPESVMTPGPGTRRLARLLPPDLAGKRVLDMCAGPAPVAVVAALRGAHVVAADLSARCIAFIEANTVLNGIELDIRQGDLYETVAGESFDVISAHPPYVELPDAIDEVLFLHGGATGEELPFRVIAGVPDHLTPGGVAAVEFHASGNPSDAAARCREILHGKGCDLVLAAIFSGSADARAATSAGVHDPLYGPGYDDLAILYRDHIERIGGDSVSAIAVLRKQVDTSKEAWSTLVSGNRLPGNWAAVAGYISSIDALDEKGDMALDARVRPPAGAKLVVEIPLGEDAGDSEYSLALTNAALASDRGLESGAARLLEILCRTATIAEGIEEFAQEAGSDPASVRDSVIAFVRESVVRGALFLETAAG
jgi:SAM-dependent methyltransferase